MTETKESVRWYQYAYADHQLFAENKQFIKCSIGFYQNEDHFRYAQNIAAERLVIKTNSYVDIPTQGSEKLEVMKNFLLDERKKNKNQSEERTERVNVLQKQIAQLETRISELEELNGI